MSNTYNYGMIFGFSHALIKNLIKMKLKIYQIILISIFSGLLFSSCKKTVDPSPPAGNGFASLKVPEGFAWSTLNKSDFSIQIVDYKGNESLEMDGFPLDATDFNGNLLQRSSIIDGKASFYLELNKSIDNVNFVLPSNGISHTISLSNPNKNFELPQNFKETKVFTDSDHDGVFDDFDKFPDDPNRAYQIFYPSPYNESTLKSTTGQFTIWYYQVFEDLWPYKGDYDFNDLTLKVRMVVNTNSSNKWTDGTFDFYVWTNGASIDLGCGLEFFQYNGTQGSQIKLKYLSNDAISLVNGTYDPTLTMMDPSMENGIIIFNKVDDVKNIDYWNTGVGNNYNPETSFLSFGWTTTTPTLMRMYMYLFYTSDRGHEIRFIGLPPTLGMNTSLLRTGEDNSPIIPWNYTAGTQFLFPNNPPFFANYYKHPWSIEIEYSGNLKVAFEKVSIIDAFPQFQAWAESGGTVNTNWYQFPVADPTKVFDVSSLIPPK